MRHRRGIRMRDPIRHLYIHIPFCPSKCSYCAFETHIGSLKLVPPYLDAIEAELGRLRVRNDAGPLQTVYFGGGTPSMLSGRDVERILASVHYLFGLAPTVEVTLECHPSTVDEGRLRGFHAAGVTRVSFGAESMVRSELEAIGRAQAAEALLACVDASRRAGFRSVALDLMYGLPTQSLASWEQTLSAAVNTGVDHLSLYPLSIEPRTVFARRKREGLLVLPEDEQVVAMYERACDHLSTAGFEHYEVANWARPGHRCAHNQAYWRNVDFLGVGVGAHAYLHPYRTENMGGTRKYIETILAGKSPVAHAERIDAETELAETLMLNLRLLADGSDLEALSARFGIDIAHRYAGDISELRNMGLVDISGSTVRLTESGVPLANEVWQRFVR